MMFFIICEIITKYFIEVMLRRFCLLVIHIIKLTFIFIVIVIIMLQLILGNRCLSINPDQHFFGLLFTYFILKINYIKLYAKLVKILKLLN